MFGNVYVCISIQRVWNVFENRWSCVASSKNITAISQTENNGCRYVVNTCVSL